MKLIRSILCVVLLLGAIASFGEAIYWFFVAASNVKVWLLWGAATVLCWVAAFVIYAHDAPEYQEEE